MCACVLCLCVLCLRDSMSVLGIVYYTVLLVRTGHVRNIPEYMPHNVHSYNTSIASFRCPLKGRKEHSPEINGKKSLRPNISSHSRPFYGKVKCARCFAGCLIHIAAMNGVFLRFLLFHYRIRTGARIPTPIWACTNAVNILRHRHIRYTQYLVTF